MARERQRVTQVEHQSQPPEVKTSAFGCMRGNAEQVGDIVGPLAVDGDLAKTEEAGPF